MTHNLMEKLLQIKQNFQIPFRLSFTNDKIYLAIDIDSLNNSGHLISRLVKKVIKLFIVFPYMYLIFFMFGIDTDIGKLVYFDPPIFSSVKKATQKYMDIFKYTLGLVEFLELDKRPWIK